MTKQKHFGKKRKFDSVAGAATMIQRAVRNYLGRQPAQRFGAKRFISAASRLARTGIRSLSRTQSAIKTGHTWTEGRSGELSSINFGYHKPFMPRSVFLSLAPIVALRNVAYSSSAAYGTQQIAALQVQNTNGQGILSSYDLTQLWAEINTYKAGYPQKVLFESVAGQHVIQNQGVANVVCRIYDCIAIKDGSSNNTGFPGNSWTNGVSDEGYSGAAAVVGATPWASEIFNQFWKVKQVTNFVLGQGMCHTHKFTFNPNRELSSMYFDSTNLQSIAGLTFQSLIVFYGAPDDSSNTTVTTATAKLDIAGSCEYRYRALEQSATTYTSLSSTIPTSGITESILNIATGAATANTQA